MNGFYVLHEKSYNGRHGGYIGGCWKEEKEVLQFLAIRGF
jgi:hypothetical protein